MKVDIWSDVICPWCYVGKRRFEAAVSEFAHGAEIEVRWRAFELQPSAPHEHEGAYASRLARKYGMTIDQAIAANDRLTHVGAEVGLEFHFDQVRSGNTFDAHRLIHLGADRGVQDAVKERFMRGYFTDGELVSDHAALARMAVDAGLLTDEVSEVLAGDEYGDAVRADEEQALDLGITGVPFFLVDGRFGIAGAQPVDAIVGVLDRAWARANPVEVLAGGEVCSDDSCTT